MTDTKPPYLLPSEVGIRRSFYGVLVCWVGEDGDDAIAITGDWRLGHAAVHALGRTDLGGPVCSDQSWPVRPRWVRFVPSDDPEQDWEMVYCGRGTEGAVQVVEVEALGTYRQAVSA